MCRVVGERGGLEMLRDVSGWGGLRRFWCVTWRRSVSAWRVGFSAWECLVPQEGGCLPFPGPRFLGRAAAARGVGFEQAPDGGGVEIAQPAGRSPLIERQDGV